MARGNSKREVEKRKAKAARKAAKEARIREHNARWTARQASVAAQRTAGLAKHTHQVRDCGNTGCARCNPIAENLAPRGGR